MKIRHYLGMLRSRLIYDFKPLNRLKMKRFYSEFIKSGDLCFDLGAHTGNRTAAWLELNARIVAVEPQPAFAELLKKKFSRHPGFTLVDKAVGKERGKTTFFISRLHPTVSTLSDEWINVMQAYDADLRWEDKVEVEIVTLDDLVHIYGIPSFCKIDIEGNEEEALESLSAPIPALSFEFFPTTPERSVKCIMILEKLGRYEYNLSMVETFRWIAENWMSPAEMIRMVKNYKGRRSGDIYARLTNKKA